MELFKEFKMKEKHLMEIFVFSEIVDKIDKDNDNNITKAELRAWMEYIQLKHLGDEVEKRWSLIDTDGDGMISWNEFKQRHYGHKMGKKLCIEVCHGNTA